MEAPWKDRNVNQVRDGVGQRRENATTLGTTGIKVKQSLSVTQRNYRVCTIISILSQWLEESLWTTIKATRMEIFAGPAGVF